MLARSVRLLLTCSATDSESPLRVMKLLAARSLVLVRLLTELDGECGVVDMDLEIALRSPGASAATFLAKELRRIRGVTRVYLVVDDQVVPFE